MGLLSKYMREIVISPFQIVGNLYRFHHILLQMVVREIKGRFAGSIGGLIWHFVHPILMMFIYLFVFVFIFKLRVGAGASGASAVYLLAGLFPWIILAEGFARGTSSVIENANLIQKTYFPTEILTAKAVLAPLLSYGISIVLLMLYMVVSNGSVGVLFILPLVVALQIFFTLGISLVSASLSVFFRDILQVVHVLVGFWMYLTPIVYPMSMLPEWARKLMYLNPIYPFISVYHSLLLEGTPGDPNLVLLSIAWTLLFFVGGAFVFNKLKGEFADWL